MAGQPFAIDNRILLNKYLTDSNCRHYHSLLFYCCLHHEACLTGRPRFYKGFGLSPCVREDHEPDHVIFPIRRSWPYW